MKSFLVKGKKPIIKWGMLPDGILFRGKIPSEYNLAVSPSVDMVVVDVDVHGKESGFENIPSELRKELGKTLNYRTKHNGRHYWFRYTGDIKLANKTSNLGIDLRTSNGYVVWYSKLDLEDSMKLVMNSSNEMNSWLESLFGYINDAKIKKL